MAKEKTNQSVEPVPPIVPASETAAASGPIGGTVTTYENLEDCLPNPGEDESE
jgi:hypothetical protein